MSAFKHTVAKQTGGKFTESDAAVQRKREETQSVWFWIWKTEIPVKRPFVAEPGRASLLFIWNKPGWHETTQQSSPSPLYRRLFSLRPYSPLWLTNPSSQSIFILYSVPLLSSHNRLAQVLAWVRNKLHLQCYHWGPDVSQALADI